MTDNRDLVTRLREPFTIIRNVPGTHGMAEAVMDEYNARSTMNEAADEIERLRALCGAVSVGPSLADIRAATKGKL